MLSNSSVIPPLDATSPKVTDNFLKWTIKGNIIKKLSKMWQVEKETNIRNYNTNKIPKEKLIGLTEHKIIILKSVPQKNNIKWDSP